MKKYIAYLDQGQGCDYTIGCGKKVISIDAESIEDAREKLINIICTEYYNDEYRLTNVVLYEINTFLVMSPEFIYDKFNTIKMLEKQREIDAKERAEFERLKSKFA